MKLQKLFKKATAGILAVVMILSALPATSFAATGDVGTISFTPCYDSDGNVIRYNSETIINGNTFGGTGSIRYRIYVDGETAFCIQPGVSLSTGAALTESSSAAWDALTEDQQKAVGLALLYGYQGNRGNLSGSVDEIWLATQILVWEFVTGCRNATGTYARTSTQIYDVICGSNYANSGTAAVYNEIIALLTAHNTTPSFMTGGTTALEYKNGEYVLTLTDSNGVLDDYDFTASTSSVSVSKSGNTLTIRAGEAFDGTVRITATRNDVPTVSSSAKLLAYGDDTLQDVVTGVENAEAVTAYMDVETPTGALALKKTSEDGEVAGITFTITGNGFSQTATTDENGTISIDGLAPGTYTVTEQISDRYETRDSQTVTIVSGQTATVTFNNTLKRGSLSVIKSSEDGLVEGVTFHLYGTSLSGIAVDEYAVTDADGVAIFENVLIGSGYTLEETSTGARYVVPDDQTVAIEWNVVTNKTVVNVLKKWRATVTKTDAETATAQGDASLAGATYGVYLNGELVDTYTTDANWQFTTNYYVCGDGWTIQEISPSEGYLLDSTVYQVGAQAVLYTIEYNSTTLGVTEQVITGSVAIIKHTDDGSTGIETPEEGAEFEVYLKSAGSYAAAEDSERDYLVCDENGYAATKDLPYGVYTVHQTCGWDGRELVSDFDVYVCEDGKVYSYIINNADFESYLKIVKTDAETGNTIPYAGAGFQIYDPEGNLVTMTYTYPEVTEIDTFYTNDEGYLITPEVLPSGEGYSIVEVQAPYGYVLDSAPVYFDVTAAQAGEEIGMTVIEVVRSDTPQKGVITVEKTGEVFCTVTESAGLYQPVYAVEGLAGAVFEITAAEDIYTPDGTLRCAQGQVVDTITTGEDGTAASVELYLGQYTVTELTAPDGYVRSDEAKTVELTYAGQEVAVTETSASFYNDRQRVSITLEKVMEQDETFGLGQNGEITLVSFGLYAAEELTAADGTAIPAGGLLEIVTVDGDGYAVFSSDLPLGSYDIKELSTEGHYILSDTEYPVTFAYAGQDTALVELAANGGEAIENELIYGTVQGLKIDRETGETISGAVFGLFAGDETELTGSTAILTAESDEDGVFTFEQVPYGDWLIAELSPAEGYLANDEVYPVTVSVDGAWIEITAVNDKIPEIGTTATINGEKQICATEVFTLEDVVSYQHLIPGEAYVLTGILMDKSTGEPVLINGETVAGETTFTPEEPSGEAVVTFTFDSRYITEDTELVVFEYLYRDGEELTNHTDIEDEGQTVTVLVPEIGTTATVNGSKAAVADGTVTIEDVVAYQNLTPGVEYLLVGILMDKSTGEALLVGGETVMAETTFTPEESNGEVAVAFTFDASGLTRETEIVVFETLYREGAEIAAHADFEDEGQTVTLTMPVISDTPQTGDSSTPMLWLSLMGTSAAGIGACGCFVRKGKKRGKKKEGKSI